MHELAHKTHHQVSPPCILQISKQAMVLQVGPSSNFAAQVESRFRKLHRDTLDPEVRMHMHDKTRWCG